MSICAKCINGTDNKKCYDIGWNKCKGNSFESKDEHLLKVFIISALNKMLRKSDIIEMKYLVADTLKTLNN